MDKVEEDLQITSLRALRSIAHKDTSGQNDLDLSVRVGAQQAKRAEWGLADKSLYRGRYGILQI